MKRYLLGATLMLALCCTAPTYAGQWQKENDRWTYLDSTLAERKTGWVIDNNKWYFMDITGTMQTGWQYVNGAWYYMNMDGSMVSDKIIDINGNKYYFHPDGHMAVNEWVKANTYHAQASGMLATSAWIDKESYVNNSGKVSSNTSVKKQKIENKTFTLSEYKSFADDSYGRYSDVADELLGYIKEYREEYNESHIYNYNGEDDNYVDSNELPDFKWDDILSKAASLRAVELASQQRASGARPDGRNAQTVLDDYGITYTSIGESVAFGQSDAESCYEDLKNGSIHTNYWRQKSYTDIGIGLAYDVEGKPYWVILYVD